ncbi:hypothetical protein D3C86_1677650 [compost metagenome]
MLAAGILDVLKLVVLLFAASDLDVRDLVQAEPIGDRLVSARPASCGVQPQVRRVRAFQLKAVRGGASGAVNSLGQGGPAGVDDQNVAVLRRGDGRRERIDAVRNRRNRHSQGNRFRNPELRPVDEDGSHLCSSIEIPGARPGSM